MKTMTFTDAMQAGLHEEMQRDARIIVLGEDVKLSPYGYTRGLDEAFPGRVRNTPIAEQTTIGTALGAAMCGLRPVVDLMMGNFFYTGWDQLANQVAKLRYMTGGQFSVPAVFVSTYGAGGNVAAQHSDVPYPQMMNLAGIKIVVPSTPYDAKGLFKAAIRDDNPVVFLTPVSLVDDEEEIPEEEYLLPLGKAKIRRQGSDITLAAIGAMLPRALQAADQVEPRGWSVEVIDLCTLNPLDAPTILGSVSRTGRLVVVDEARQLCSVASEVAALAVEQAFHHLKAPVLRVTAANVPVPFSPPLEDYVIPGVDRIVDALCRVMEGSK